MGLVILFGNLSHDVFSGMDLIKIFWPLVFYRAQVVGWPPVRSYRKNTLAMSATKTNGEDEGRSEAGCCYVKVSMDGAPYLRKVDLKTFSSYEDLSLALEKMFTCFITGECFCFLLVLMPDLPIYLFHIWLFTPVIMM
jgi:hypothetical protein